MSNHTKKQMIEFLDEIPDDRINNLYTPGITPGPLFEGKILRLDWQKFTSGKGDQKKYNVHVQTNLNRRRMPPSGGATRANPWPSPSSPSTGRGRTWTLYLWSSDPLVNDLPVEPQEFALEEGPRRDAGREEMVDLVVGDLVEVGDEGILRLSGSSVVIRSLRDRFNAEGDVNLLTDGHSYDVHAVASLLTLCLRELPASVLTRELPWSFCVSEAKIERLRTLVHQLPRAKYSLLRARCSFLITIVENSDADKMTVRNVGIVVLPTLNIPAPVLSSTAAVVDEMASPPPPPPPPPPPHLAPAPTDIRSPRRQMFQDLPRPAFHQVSFPKTPHLASASFAPALHHPPEAPAPRSGPHAPASHGDAACPVRSWSGARKRARVAARITSVEMTNQLKKDMIEFLEEIPDDRIERLYTPGITSGSLFEGKACG
ncbi:MAG: hypothetical protein M1826_001369 [Phylliscum demangeonii]|nr:MAG: hypothetical protein M1826_001369 [Phylliscum demangeonii]